MLAKSSNGKRQPIILDREFPAPGIVVTLIPKIGA